MKDEFMSRDERDRVRAPGLQGRVAEAERSVVRTIILVVSQYYGLKRGDLRARTREWRVAWPRAVAMCLMMEHTGMAKTRIGRVFGMAPSSPIWARGMVDDEMATSAERKREVREVGGLVRGTPCGGEREEGRGERVGRKVGV